MIKNRIEPKYPLAKLDKNTELINLKEAIKNEKNHNSITYRIACHGCGLIDTGKVPIVSDRKYMSRCTLCEYYLMEFFTNTKKFVYYRISCHSCGLIDMGQVPIPQDKIYRTRCSNCGFNLLEFFNENSVQTGYINYPKLTWDEQESRGK